jgi:hypothetical protein
MDRPSPAINSQPGRMGKHVLEGFHTTAGSFSSSISPMPHSYAGVSEGTAHRGSIYVSIDPLTPTSSLSQSSFLLVYGLLGVIHLVAFSFKMFACQDSNCILGDVRDQ